MCLAFYGTSSDSPSSLINKVDRNSMLYEECLHIVQPSGTTQAFDRMPRSRLYEGMWRLELPQDLIHVLMAWHADIHYTIRHADQFLPRHSPRLLCCASALADFLS